MTSPLNAIEIFQKLVSDPRVVNVVTTVLSELLSSESSMTTNTAQQSTPVTESKPAKQKTVSKKAKDYDYWISRSEQVLRAAYMYRKNNNIEFDADFQAALTARFPGYDPETKLFTGRKHKAKSESTVMAKSIVLSNEEIARKSNTEKNVTQPQQVPSDNPTILSVKLKMVKQTLDATYYDVYVNGKKILRKHANTELKLFANGTLLGIRGIVTDQKNLPQRSMWTLFKTDLTQLQWPGKDVFSQYDLYAKTVLDTPNNVHITLNNNSIRVSKIETFTRIAGQKRFEIER